MISAYSIRRLPEETGRYPLQGPFDPAQLAGTPYERLQEARLSAFPWDKNGYRPDCRARVGWNRGGLHVLMYAFEAEIRAEINETGGPVCRDSCLEFFLSPGGDGPYFNCEVSPRPTAHLAVGEGRHGRRVFFQLPPGMNLVSSRHEGGWWAVSYTIPTAFLQEEFGVTPACGLNMKGNFYKCGDDCALPHYGMYHPYNLPAADYHRPELFADFVTEE